MSRAIVSNPPFISDLCEHLLRAGVKPGVAHRYAAELSDHFDDLLRSETQEAALRRLGSPEDLAEAMLAQPGVRSWTARAPWLTLALGPLLGVLLGCILPALALFLFVRAFAADLDYGRSALPGTWPILVLQGLYGFNDYLLPILAGWIAVAMSLRQRAGAGWMILGAVLTAVLGCGLYLQLDWQAGHPAAVQFGVGYRVEPFFTTVWGHSPETGLFDFLAILAPYGVWWMRNPRLA